MTPILRTQQLSREAEEGRRVIDNISLTVMPGEVVSITGPSGSGKSSLLRLLNRLDEPTSGTVFIDGKDYRTLAPTALRRRVGLVMQNAYLFPGTIGDNLRYGPAQQGKVVHGAEVAMWLEHVGLPGTEDQEISRLSGGEAQRVSIARALVNNPEILLLDEPTSALDEESKKHVEQLIAELIRQDRLTCLIVTHDAEQAARLASRTVVIEQGRVVEDRQNTAPHA